MTRTDLKRIVDPAALASPAERTALDGEDVARILHYVDKSVSDNTRRVYTSAWRRFTAWCETRGHEPLPAAPDVVAAYLTARAQETNARGLPISAATIDVARAAIRYHHLSAGMPDISRNPGLTRVVEGIHRELGLAPTRQSHPLTTAQLRRVLEHVDRTTLAGRRDAALMLVGFAAALRRDELVSLDVCDVAPRTDGMTVTIRKAKGDQRGHGAVVAVPRGTHHDTDVVTAFTAWVTAAGLAPGDPLFQRVRRGATKPTGQRLGGRSVALILQARAQAAGMADIANLSAHSLRSGHITTAAEAGMRAEQIARTSRHRRIDTVAKYTRPADAMRDTSAAVLGL